MNRMIIVALVALALAAPAAALAQPPAPVWTEEGRAAVKAAAVSEAPLPAPDPAEDPGAFWDAFKAGFSSSPLLGIVLLLWGLARVTYRFGARVPWLGDKLQTPRARMLLVGGMAALATALGALAGGLNPASAMLGLAAALVALYMTPEPKKAPSQ